MSFYRMQRGWMEKGIFEREPFDRRSAWMWLIEHAAFAPHNGIERGQIRASYRFLAMAWRWSEPKVRRWIAAAEKAEMIRCVADAGKSLITICNYGKYQLPLHVADALPDTHPTQPRRVADANYKEGKKDSVADATARPDPIKDLWDRGKALLRDGGVPDPRIGPLIGSWRRDFKDPAVMAAIQAAEVELPSDIVSFMVGSMSRFKSGNGHGQNKAERWLNASLQAIVDADHADLARGGGA
jgi:hypothetical protein